MKIAVIGAGNVGTSLGQGWTKAGHSVQYGVRDASDAKVAGLSVASVPEAAAAAEVVAFATPWEATKNAVQSAGDLNGKVVLDCTNPVTNDLSGLNPGNTFSAGEQVAQWAPGARVVKIFNTVGNNIMQNPRFGNEGALLFYCGDDAEAKKTAARLATDLGFNPVDAGPLAEARWLEAFALLWIRLAVFNGLGREFAFKLLRR